MSYLEWILIIASVVSLGSSFCLMHISALERTNERIKLDLWYFGLGAVVLAVVFTLAAFIVA